jgi:hypothetical protein
MNDAPRGKLRLTPIQWLIATIASIGFAFDTYEILMLPLIVRPALAELLGVAPGSPEYFRWVRLLFFVPMLCGGVFGLVGGYLTDRFGRRRVLVWSILLYAFSAFGAAFSTSVEMLLLLRCTTLIGVCVEFVAGVAWIAELFPQARQRESVLGFTQAFASLGGLLVASFNVLAIRLGTDWPAIAGGHEAWRYTLMSGLIPALPLLLVRPWLPESPTWARKRAEGTLKRPSLAELFTPALRKTTLVTTLLVAAGYALAFGAIQHMPQIVPGLSDVRSLPPPDRQAAAATAQTYQEIGGLAGRFLLAVLVVRIVSRRRLLRLFQVPALVVLPVVFWLAPAATSSFARWGIFLCGLVVVAQFSFWGNYLPRVYPTHLRGTGESFAANVGGRVFGTTAVLATTSLAAVMPGADGATSLAHAAAVVALVAAAVGVVATSWLPEPRTEELPE